jgi:glycosyltransferase involved in cell wall biosynthesis
MELPIITTNVGGLDEVVTDGENGYIIPVNDEEALAEKLRLLVNSLELRRKLGQKGKSIVEEKFNLLKNAEIIVGYLKKAASRASKHRTVSLQPGSATGVGASN